MRHVIYDLLLYMDDLRCIDLGLGLFGIVLSVLVTISRRNATRVQAGSI